MAVGDNDFPNREVDATRPSAARMYHYFLTGEAIFDVDGIYGEQALELVPLIGVASRHNRAFLQRAVRFIVGCGVRQFLDIGSGLPTADNTHEVAQRLAPGTRVVYVDNDLEAVNQSYDMLAGQGVLDTTAVVDSDLRNTEAIFEHPDTRRLIDFDKPLGLLVVGVWHFVPDADQPYEVMKRLRSHLPADSYVAMSHSGLQDIDRSVVENTDEALEDYNQRVTDSLTLRDRPAFGRFFDGLELVEPGVVYAPEWRPDQPVDLTDPMHTANLAAVGIVRR